MKHREPVHFNRGRHGHAWICTACGVQLSGPKLPDDEREILVAFAKAMRGNGKDLKVKTAKATTAPEGQNGEKRMENTDYMQLTICVPMGSTPGDIAAKMRFQAGLLEGMSPKEAASRDNTDAAPKSTPLVKKTKKTAPVEDSEAEASDDDDEDFGASTKKAAAKKKATTSFDDDGDDDGEAEAEETEASDDDDEDFSAPAKKKAATKAKAPKITADDVNDACKKKAKETDRKTVLAILKKKFKVESVQDLKPEQYAAVIEAMTGE